MCNTDICCWFLSATGKCGEINHGKGQHCTSKGDTTRCRLKMPSVEPSPTPLEFVGDTLEDK